MRGSVQRTAAATGAHLAHAAAASSSSQQHAAHAAVHAAVHAAAPAASAHAAAAVHAAAAIAHPHARARTNVLVGAPAVEAGHGPVRAGGGVLVARGELARALGVVPGLGVLVLDGQGLDQEADDAALEIEKNTTPPTCTHTYTHKYWCSQLDLSQIMTQRNKIQH